MLCTFSQVTKFSSLWHFLYYYSLQYSWNQNFGTTSGVLSLTSHSCVCRHVPLSAELTTALSQSSHSSSLSTLTSLFKHLTPLTLHCCFILITSFSLCIFFLFCHPSFPHIQCHRMCVSSSCEPCRSVYDKKRLGSPQESNTLK